MAKKLEAKVFVPKPRKKRPGMVSKPRGMKTALTGKHRN